MTETMIKTGDYIKDVTTEAHGYILELLKVFATEYAWVKWDSSEATLTRLSKLKIVEAQS